MNVMTELNEAREKIKLHSADMAKLQGCADEYKATIETVKAELTAKLTEKDGVIAGLQKNLADAATSFEIVAKQAESDKAKIAELTAKLSLAPYGDVTPGTEPVLDGGAAPEPKASLLEQFKALGNLTPEAIKFYRDHEKEIDAQMARK